MTRSTTFVILFIAELVFGSGAAFAESRIALVIGQSAYSAVVPLPNTTNDAKMMGQLLTDAGFEVTSAPDLTQTQLRETVGEFTAKIAAKGPDTIVVLFYAGHGLQVDGENFLIPVDLNPKREADVSLQAVRLNDILNTLASVPSKMRIVMIDACRNNPFPDISRTTGRGLALVDAKSGASDSFLTYSTSPGAEAEDGTGSNSPYTAALLVAAREPNLPIEETFKRVRIAVNKATDGRQIPWESSSLTQEFRFFPAQTTAADAAAPAAISGGAASTAVRSVSAWRKDLQGLQPEAAYEMVVADNSAPAYQAFIDEFAQPPYGPRIRVLLERRYEMLAWAATTNLNTAAGYRAFLASYPTSDLAPTARKLEERMRNRTLTAANANAAVPEAAPQAVGIAGAAAASSLSSSGPSTPAAAGSPPVNAALAAPTCPCSVTPPALVPHLPQKKVEHPPRKKAEPPSRKRAEAPPPRRVRHRQFDEEEVVTRPVPRDDGGVAAGGFIGGGMMGGGRGYGGGGGGYRPNFGGGGGGFRR